MKKLLMITAMSIATLAPAKAAQPTIPPEYRGDWCYRSPTGGYLIQRKHLPPTDCVEVITLTATGYRAVGGDCKLTTIKHSVRPNIGDGGIVHGKVNLPSGEFDCDHGDVVKFIFTTGSGSLGWKVRRLYFEPSTTEDEPDEPAPTPPPPSSLEYCKDSLSACMWRVQ
jgi:hypothetical protein